jgi:hypothetical protein
MDIVTILQELNPGAQWVLDGDDYEGLTWLDDSPKPTKKALEDAWPEVQHTRAVAQVEQARAQAYRETADPLFFQYQRGEATEAEWLAAVEAVKTAHPYPVA